MRNYLLSAIICISIVLFIGCLGGSHSENQESEVDTEIRSSIISVDSLGRFKFESPYSNLIIEASDEQTFDSEAEILLIEKTPEKSDSSIFKVASKIYSVSAYLTHNGVRTSDIKNVEPPITIKIPKPIEEEPESVVYYLGVRDWSKAAWQYTLIGDYNNNIENIYMPSKRAVTSEGNYFVITTRNVFCEFAIFSESKKNPTNLVCRVANMNISASPEDILLTQSTEINDKLLHYEEDILISICLELQNQTFSFSPVTCRIENQISFSSTSQIFPEKLKINNGDIKFTNLVSSSNKESSGNKYLHTITFDSPIDSVTSNIATFSFTINTKGMSILDFPTIFTVKSVFIPSQENNKISISFAREADFNREIVSGLVTTNLTDRVTMAYSPKFSYYGHSLKSFKIEAINKSDESATKTKIEGNTEWNNINNTITFFPSEKWARNSSYIATATVRCCEQHQPKTTCFSFLTSKFEGSGTKNDPYIFTMVSPERSATIPVDDSVSLVIDALEYDFASNTVCYGQIDYTANNVEVESSPILNAIFYVSDGKLIYMPAKSQYWLNGKVIEATATINLSDTETAIAGTFLFKTRTEAFELLDPTKPNSEDNPYLVTTNAQLAAIGKEDYPTGYFRQINDINMSDTNQTIPDPSAPNDFYGYYDGNGFSIIQPSLPLFENFKGTITNSNIFNAYINIRGPAGVIAMCSTGGKITNVNLYNPIVVSQDDDCGTFVGKVTPTSSLTINDSKAEGFDPLRLKGVNVGCFIGSAENASISLEGNICSIHGVSHPETSNQYMTGNLTATPTVIISPEDGTTDFGISAPIVLTFNKPMRTDSITPLTLQFSPTVSYTMNWDTEKRILTINHGTPLENSRLYRLSMAANKAQDIFNSVYLPNAIETTFTTEEESLQTFAYVEIPDECKIGTKVNYKPTFIIHFSRAMHEDAKNAVYINKNTEIINSGINKSWSTDFKDLTVSITNSLETSQEYFISINSIAAIDINNNEISPFNNYLFSTSQFSGTGEETEPYIVNSGDFSPSGPLAVTNASSTVAISFKPPFNDFGAIQNSSKMTYNGNIEIDGTFSVTDNKIYFIPTGMNNDYWPHDKTITAYANIITENSHRNMKVGPITFTTPMFTLEDTTKVISRTNPYLIYTQEQLTNIKENGSTYMNSHFKQVRDIALPLSVWSPIGNATYAFRGTYNGNNMRITNLTSNGLNYAGLFGKINMAKISNIKLEINSLTGTENIGGIAAYAIQSEISNNEIISGVITAGSSQHAGCIVGYSENCNIYENKCNIHTHLNNDNVYMTDNLSSIPTVVSISPENAISNVSVNPTIIIKFNKPILESSLTTSSLYFRPTTNYTKSLDETKTILTITPVNSLESITTYWLTLKSGLIKDIFESKSLETDITSWFKTQEEMIYTVASVEADTNSLINDYINYKPVFNISFSRTMNESSINSVTLQRNGTIITDVTKSWNIGKTQVILAVNSPLELSSDYQIAIDSNLAIDSLGENIIPFTPKTFTTYSLAGTGTPSDPIQINSGYGPTETIKSLAFPISFEKPDINTCGNINREGEVKYSIDGTNYIPIEGSFSEESGKVFFTPSNEGINYWPPNSNISAIINFKCCNKLHSIVTNTPITFTTPMLGLEKPNSAHSNTNPYLIYTAAQLEAIGDTNNDTGENDLNCYYKQVRDIVLHNEHNPIGKSDSPFTGYYNGNSHSISGLEISTHQLLGGLFGQNNGTVENVNLTITSITNTENVGGIAGINSGIIKNCIVDGIQNITVYSDGNSGCIAGSNSGTISNNICSSHTHINNEQEYMITNLSKKPQIISFIPENESTEISINSNWQITFNKPINQTTFTTSSITITPPDANLSNEIEWNENSTVVTVKPSTDLIYDTEYTINIPENIIKDTYTGITGSAYTTKFHTTTTGDEPTVDVTVNDSYYVISDKINYKPQFIAKFSKPMKETAKDAVKLEYSGGEHTNITKVWSSDNKTLTISVTDSLLNNTKYTITINKNMARDKVNLALTGQNTFDFTTFIYKGLGTTADPFKITPDLITINTPKNLKQPISLAKPDFTNCVTTTASSGTTKYSYFGGGSDISISCNYSREDNIYSITPTNLNNNFWLPNAKITATIDFKCCGNANHNFRISPVEFTTPMFGLDNPNNPNNSANRYEIYTAEQLAALSECGEYTGGNDLAGYYKQIRDINLSAVNPFKPIGTIAKPFSGQYNGNDFNITNLDNSLTNDYGGLFGCVDGGIIENIKLSAISIKGNLYTGGFISYLINGILRNCVLNAGADIKGNSNIIGCIVGKKDAGNLTGITCMLANHSHTLIDDDTFNYMVGNLGEAPQILSVTNEAGKAFPSDTNKLALTDKIIITFNKPINTSSITDSTLTLKQGETTINYAKEWNDTQTKLTIVPTSALPLYDSDYTLKITANTIEDYFKNKILISEYTCVLHTTEEGTAAEATVNIANSEKIENIYITCDKPTITVNFTKAMQASSLSFIKLTQSSNEVETTKTWNNNETPTILTIVPTNDLATSTLYKIEIDSSKVRSKDNLLMNDFTNYEFTTFKFKGKGTNAIPIQIDSGFTPTGLISSSTEPIIFDIPFEHEDESDIVISGGTVNYNTGGSSSSMPGTFKYLSPNKIKFTPNTYWPFSSSFTVSMTNIRCCSKSNHYINIPRIRLSTGARTKLNPDNPDNNQDNPYLVYELNQLNDIRNHLGDHYKLMNNIELPNTWEPIGTIDNQFTGSLDGNYLTLSNLARNNREYVSLFGYGCGEIRNLNITVNSMYDIQYFGGIAYSWARPGLIYNCKIQGISNSNIRAKKGIGGIVASSSANIKYCENSGSMEFNINSNEISYIGGIIGIQNGIAEITDNKISSISMSSANDNTDKGCLIGSYTIIPETLSLTSNECNAHLAAHNKLGQNSFIRNLIKPLVSSPVNGSTVNIIKNYTPSQSIDKIYVNFTKQMNNASCKLMQIIENEPDVEIGADKAWTSEENIMYRIQPIFNNMSSSNIYKLIIEETSKDLFDVAINKTTVNVKVYDKPYILNNSQIDIIKDTQNIPSTIENLTINFSKKMNTISYTFKNEEGTDLTSSTSYTWKNSNTSCEFSLPNTLDINKTYTLTINAEDTDSLSINETPITVKVYEKPYITSPTTLTIYKIDQGDGTFTLSDNIVIEFNKKMSSVYFNLVNSSLLPVAVASYDWENPETKTKYIINLQNSIEIGVYTLTINNTSIDSDNKPLTETNITITVANGSP